ncbi:MAG: hypothetical protein KAJ08_01445, partial [Deltaproteobacteria bacterium]|nr:hypothetical protein [Deltaproteobacteria bacterium]
DSNGNKEWDKTFGGTSSDEANSVQQTSDAGYIIAGCTRSFGAGQSDGWLVKTDSNGNKEWDKTFGGVEYNWAESVQQTTDGGYIIAGRTQSFGAGQSDGWLVKTDSNGNKEWDKTFGGSNKDYAESVQQTSDGGYIFAGMHSPTTWLVKTDSNGGYIFEGWNPHNTWLVKTDSNGNKEWDKTFVGASVLSEPTFLLIGGAAILLSLVHLAGKFRRKEQGTPRFPSPIAKSNPSTEPMQRFAPLRNEASSKLKRAKSMLNKSGQLGVDTSQLEDILAKAEQAFQKENYTQTIDYVKNYLALIDKAEKNKKQLKQMRKTAFEQIKSAKFLIEKAERIGVTIQHVRELNTKAQSAFDANDYNSAISYANKSRSVAEQLIDESKPSISIELPPKMEYKAWKHRDLIVTNEGTADAVAIWITFLTALEVRDFKVIKRLDAGEQKTINVNMKPTEKGDVPVDYSVEFKDILDRVYKTEDTATIQISTDIETTWESVTSPSEKVKTESNKLVVLRKEEFFNGFTRLKISVQNKMQLTATDV